MASDPIELPSAAQVSANLSEWAAADSGLAYLLSTGIAPAQALARWGMRLLRESHSDRAAAAFRSAAALAPADPLLWTNLGIALDRTDSTAESEGCLQRALALVPAQADTWILLASVRRKRGDLSGAAAACGSALEHEPASSIAWQWLGLVKQEQRQYAEAIDCFARCAEYGGKDGAVMANLGRLCYQIGRFSEAFDGYDEAVRLDPANAHYQQMRRRVRFMKDVLLGIAVEAAVESYVASLPQGTGIAEADIVALFKIALGTLSGFGHTEAAGRVGRKWRELSPRSVEAEYLLRAIDGDRSLVRSPADFIVEHFDEFAVQFEERLVGTLGYDVPWKICAAVREQIAPGAVHDVLDAGCGTGLCGPLLRPLARDLTGVDLSGKMLELARLKSVYDSLVCEELTAFLERSPGRFDLVVAADVLIYFGDLAPVFAAAAGALRAGGVLAVSTESHTGQGYELRGSGRFASAPAYVRSVAMSAFEECACIDTTVRLEAAERVRGNIFIFRRR
jgi:predicted TPR repeat methyltransferase